MKTKCKKKHKNECQHKSFWFDRTIAYCSVHDDEEMAEVCNDCGKSACQIDYDKRNS